MAKDSLDEKHSENTVEPDIIPRVPGGLIEQNEIALPLEGDAGAASLSSERRQVARSASLVMLGNLGSSVMGMVRQAVIAAIGAKVASPFNSALLPARTFNDLLVNGSVSGALIPTLNDYSAPEKRDELRRIVFTLVNLLLILTFVASVLYLFIAPRFIYLLVSGYSADDKALTLLYSQIIFFSLMALAPFAVLLSALFALKEFGWPAFATASYHIGIILGAFIGSLLGERYFGHLGLAVGVLVGALGEIVLLLPGIRRHHLYYMFVLDLKHPALRRIFKLYGPVAFSFLVTMGLVFLDQHLASLTPGPGKNPGEDNTLALNLATTLIQFPVGLVAAALSFAVLPNLTEHARGGDSERFKQVLLLGFRVGLLLMIPAAAGLIVLREPIVNLIFHHHNFTPQNAHLTAIALQNYAYQLPFVAIDQLLIAAFYARKNTITPVVVGVICIGGYLVVALPFYKTIGMPALAFANTVQNSLHAIILLVLLRLAIGSIRVRETIPTILKILFAAALMIAVAWALQTLLAHFSLFSLNTLLGQLLTVAIAGGTAAGVYVGGVLLLRVEEVGLVRNAVLAKLGKR